jgi:hypothetical protein
MTAALRRARSILRSTDRNIRNLRMDKPTRLLQRHACTAYKPNDLNDTANVSVKNVEHFFLAPLGHSPRSAEEMTQDQKET